MATLSFTDATGAATLDNGKPAPANRFVNWMPMPRPVGEVAHRQSDGLRIMYVLREQQGASFEYRQIPDRGGMIDIAARLVAHLLRGGTCTVTTGDIAARVYTGSLMPGTEPSLSLADPKLHEFTLSLSLIGGTALWACHYRA